MTPTETLISLFAIRDPLLKVSEGEQIGLMPAIQGAIPPLRLVEFYGRLFQPLVSPFE